MDVSSKSYLIRNHEKRIQRSEEIVMRIDLNKIKHKNRKINKIFPIVKAM